MPAKTTKKTNSNIQPFWDFTMLIGYINTDDLHKTSVSLCEKDGKNYVSITKLIRTQSDPNFKPRGGTAIPYQSAQQVAALLEKAFKEGHKIGW